MAGRLSGKVAIVTGSGNGIGAVLATGFAGEGALLCIADKDTVGAKKTQKEILKFGGKAIVTETDVSKPEDVMEMVKATISTYKQIDVLINNAGIALYAPFLEYSIEDWHKTLDVNLTGCFLCAQAVAKEMVKRENGKIINISSIAGAVGLPNSVAYTSTKAGISGMTRVLAVELAPKGIAVNAIGPGAIMTSMAKKTLKEEDRRAREAMVPMGRYGVPEDLIECAVFLASSGSDYLTGQTLYVDGGYLASGVSKRH